MKKINFIVLGIAFVLLSSFASSFSDYKNFGTFSSVSNNPDWYGYEFEIVPGYIVDQINITKNPSDGSTLCHLFDYSNNIIASGSFLSNVCSINGISIPSGRYKVVGNHTTTRNVYYNSSSSFPYLSNSGFFVINNRTSWSSGIWITDDSNLPLIQSIFLNFSISIFQLNLKNIYDGSYISNFTAQITNSTDSINITTTNGTIYYFNDQIVDISIFDINENTFFNQSYSDLNTSSSFIAETWQSVLVVNAKEKITNLSIGNFNVSIIGAYPGFNESNSSNQTTHYLNVDASGYNITGKAAGYLYNSTASVNTSLLDVSYVTLFFGPDELNITAKDYFSNATISSFNVVVEYNDSYSESISTTNGLAQFYGINGTYNVSISASGYSSTSVLINLTNSSRNYYFSLFPSNSVYIHIYDQSTGDLISQNVSILFASKEIIFTNYSATGGFFIANLSATNYTITFDSINYSSVSYNIVVASGSTQSLDAFMLPDSYADYVIYTIYDKNSKDQPLQECSVMVSKIVGTSWEVVYSLTSDITGRVAFYFISGETYKLTFMKSGYETQVVTFSPILFTSYDIFMTPEISANINYDYGNINIEYSPYSYSNNETIEFVIQFISPGGIFDYFGYNITWTDGFGDHLVSNLSYNVYGDVLSSYVNITDASWGQYVYLTYFYKTASGELKTFSGSFYINDASGSAYTFYGHKGDTYGLGLYERVLVGTLIILLSAGGISYFVGSVPAIIFSIVVYGFLIYLEFIPYQSAIISMVVLFFVFVWRSSQ